MTTEKLLDAIGDIDPEAVMDAKQSALHSEKSKRGIGVRRLLTVAAAALLVLALAGTAAAYFGAADWFVGYFEKHSDAPLSMKQQELIEEKTVGIGQSITSGGVTVTLESAFSDGYTGLIKLNVTAPEGINLTDLSGLNFESDLFCQTPDGKVGVSRGSWPTEDDGDGRENTITAIMEVEAARGIETGGYPWTLRLENLCAYSEDYPYEEYVVAECEFTFQFEFSETEEQTGELVFDFEPFACPGARMMGDVIDVQVETFTLRSMGAEASYTFFEGDTPESLDFSALKVHMKDGCVLVLQISSSAVYNHWDAENAVGFVEFKSDVPIVLEEVESVEFPGGTVIPYGAD